MIFIVLGTQKFQLNRLLQVMDRYIEEGTLETTDVFAQIGHSDYEPRNYKFERFMDKDKFDRTIQQADILIAHSGVGTIITGVNAHKPVIVYPRMAKFHEHVDDHQLDIARAFEKKNYVLCCYETESLSDKIEECKSHQFDEYHSQREKIVGIINDFLKKTEL